MSVSDTLRSWGRREGPTRETRAAQIGPWGGLDGALTYGDAGQDAMSNLGFEPRECLPKIYRILTDTKRKRTPTKRRAAP